MTSRILVGRSIHWETLVELVPQKFHVIRYCTWSADKCRKKKKFESRSSLETESNSIIIWKLKNDVWKTIQGVHFNMARVTYRNQLLPKISQRERLAVLWVFYLQIVFTNSQLSASSDNPPSPTWYPSVAWYRVGFSDGLWRTRRRWSNTNALMAWARDGDFWNTKNVSVTGCLRNYCCRNGCKKVFVDCFAPNFA